MVPRQIDEFVQDIRSTYRGPLQIAHDLMRIDL
jgi:ribonuclease Z